MQHLLQCLQTVTAFLSARLAVAHGDERGSPTIETVIIAALMSAVAITAVGFIVNAIMTHANAIK